MPPPLQKMILKRQETKSYKPTYTPIAVLKPFPYSNPLLNVCRLVNPNITPKAKPMDTKEEPP